jgi:hypothetical protein
VHLVGFTVGICYDARTCERQIGIGQFIGHPRAQPVPADTQLQYHRCKEIQFHAITAFYRLPAKRLYPLERRQTARLAKMNMNREGIKKSMMDGQADKILQHVTYETITIYCYYAIPSSLS